MIVRPEVSLEAISVYLMWRVEAKMVKNRVFFVVILTQKSKLWKHQCVRGEHNPSESNALVQQIIPEGHDGDTKQFNTKSTRFSEKVVFFVPWDMKNKTYEIKINSTFIIVGSGILLTPI